MDKRLTEDRLGQGTHEQKLHTGEMTTQSGGTGTVVSSNPTPGYKLTLTWLSETWWYSKVGTAAGLCSGPVREAAATRVSGASPSLWAKPQREDQPESVPSPTRT